MYRVHFLDVDSHVHNRRLICAIYDCWLNSGVIGSTKALSIRLPGHDSPLPLGDPPQSLSGFDSREHCDKFLLPLPALHLKNVRFPWDSPAYHGLVDLRLDFTNVTSTVAVSQSVFAGILASSPRLQTLKLKDLILTKAPNWDESTSYRLDYLKVLNLDDMPTNSLCLLLPLITPPQDTEGLSTSLPISTGNEFAKVLKAFLKHSRITTLHLALHGFAKDIADVIPFLDNLTSLECIAIRGNTLFSESTPPPIFNRSRLDASQETQIYCLNEMHLISHKVDLERIKPLVSMYRIRTLYLIACDFYVRRSYVTFEEFRDLLFQKFIDVNCISLPLDLAVKWPYVVMED